MARALNLGVADRVAIADLYRRGHSTHCVARQVGISQTAVCYHLRAAQVAMRARPRGRPEPCCLSGGAR